MRALYISVLPRRLRVVTPRHPRELIGGNTESKWKKPWETSMTQEQAHLTGSLVTDRWFRLTGRHDVSATTQGVKPRGGRGAFMRHQLVSSPFSLAIGLNWYQHPNWHIRSTFGAPLTDVTMVLIQFVVHVHCLIFVNLPTAILLFFCCN
ncbi:uncharacterized protein LOC135098418 isoform X2 [Scylla paramamosain]|uniref:uncharacterized protein LOC135098418 isoform X2 n=1 Tax=Scylla paramamosain TaxID=85552 RepID=UPI0030835CD0